MSHPPRSKQSSATSHALRFPNTTSLRLPLREQVQRLHRGQVREIQMGQLDQDRIGRRDGEEAELLGVARVGRALASRFELGEQRLGSRDDGIGQAGQARDLDAVAPVGAARPHLVQEDDLVVPLAYGDVEVSDGRQPIRSEEHTSELQSRQYLVCRLLLEKKKKK